ncbi:MULTISPECIES: hypothetical protein [unclassified Anabaena]|uniref:hypothetical protein n=1 Tax=unclassified Anabaena TaxID=2619674 RepID=UPI002B1F734B|nr:hypothetical protein [Anabaena sp. UHCC 0399]MEA5569101.1 hypothetical protein [Anabaena sp. UHCC 0399]
MNVNIRFTMAMILTITGTLITTVAKVNAQSVEEVQSQPLSTQVSPQILRKVDILRPNSKFNSQTQDRFRLFDQFRDNTPGWIEVKKDPFQRRIEQLRPSAVDTFQKIGH